MFSPHSNFSDREFLKSLLHPLLEDFQYWFERSRHLLESYSIDFLGSEKQSELLERVKQAQQEVSTTQMLLNVTDGQVGVETAVLLPWHHLVTECWQIGMRFRREHPHLIEVLSADPAHDSPNNWQDSNGSPNRA